MNNASLLLFGFFLLLAFCGSPEQKSDESAAAVEEEAEIVQEAREESPPHPGEEVYRIHCLSCHQSDGSGVPGMYPPIINTDWVSGDKERLIGIILFGMEGPMEVNGEHYSSIMPEQSYLSDQEIADVLTFIRSNFDNQATPVVPEEVAAVREKGK